MAKAPTLADITSGYYSTQTLNTNFTNISEAFENTLSLDGSTPNAMEADLDMDGNVIVNAVLGLMSYTVAGAPSASGRTGQVIYVTDGDAGSPCVAVSTGSAWKRISLGATISAS